MKATRNLPQIVAWGTETRVRELVGPGITDLSGRYGRRH